MDLIIFGGQSNMQGATESLPVPNNPVEGAWEYRLSIDDLISLKHPVGENVRSEQWLAASCEGGGSILPAFCRTYVETCGRKVVAVHAAKGSTTIAEWLYGTQHYFYMRKKALACIEKLKNMGELARVFYVWLQGESDAVIHTTEQEYFERLVSFKNRIKLDLGIEKFGIIKVGYFSIDGEKYDEAIMRAQERAVKQDSDFVMLSRVCPLLSKDIEYMNTNCLGHYNNKAMEIIGAESGKILASFTNNL